MKARGLILLLAVTLAVSILGCSQEPLFTTPDGDSHENVKDYVYVDVVINGYLVRFDGRTYGDGETTFHYTVAGLDDEADLTHFALQLPDCAPEPSAFAPTQGATVGTNPQTEIYGVEWDLPIQPDDDVGRQYSITFPGDVPLGTISASVQNYFGNDELQGYSSIETGTVLGPCAGSEASGRVFIDANENSERDPSEELGIADVVIELIDDSEEQVYTTTTDEFGDYSFEVAPGTYTVNIDLAGYPDAFNQVLGELFIATTPLTFEVTVGVEGPEVDFGFNPDADKIIEELDVENLVSNGRSRKYWRKELHASVKLGVRSFRDYDDETLQGFVEEIQNLYLSNIYTFTPGMELNEAHAILWKKEMDLVEALFQELLVTEFNEVAGFGLIGDENLQEVLIAWGEALLADSLNDEEPSGQASFGDKADTGRLVKALMIFNLMNTGGGGEVDE